MAMFPLLEPDDRLANWLAERNQPRFRLSQIRHWLFAGRARQLDDMSDLPKDLRQFADGQLAFRAQDQETQSRRLGDGA